MGPAVAGLLPARDRFDPIRMTFVCDAVQLFPYTGIAAP